MTGGCYDGNVIGTLRASCHSLLHLTCRSSSLTYHKMCKDSKVTLHSEMSSKMYIARLDEDCLIRPIMSNNGIFSKQN